MLFDKFKMRHPFFIESNFPYFSVTTMPGQLKRISIFTGTSKGLLKIYSSFLPPSCKFVSTILVICLFYSTLELLNNS